MALDFSDYDPSQTFQRPLPGKCHLLVAAVEEREKLYEVTCDILSHEDESQVGKTVKVRLQKSGKGARRQQNFLIATKVITLEEILEAVSRGETEVDPDLNDAVGVTFFSTLEEGSYTSSKTNKEIQTCDIGFEFIGADSDDAKDYPRDEEFAPLVVAAKKEEPKTKTKTKTKTKAKKEENVTTPVGDDDCPF